MDTRSTNRSCTNALNETRMLCEAKFACLFNIGCAPCPSNMISIVDLFQPQHCLSRSHHPPYRRAFIPALRTSSCTASFPSWGTTALFTGTHLRSSDCLFFHSSAGAPLVVTISFHRFVFVFQLLSCSHVPWLFLLDARSRSTWVEISIATG